jgi:hypothetical protein
VILSKRVKLRCPCTRHEGRHGTGDEDEWSAAQLGRGSPATPAGTHRTEGWLSFGAGVTFWGREKSLPLPGLEPQIVQPLVPIWVQCPDSEEYWVTPRIFGIIWYGTENETNTVRTSEISKLYLNDFQEPDNRRWWQNHSFFQKLKNFVCQKGYPSSIKSLPTVLSAIKTIK